MSQYKKNGAQYSKKPKKTKKRKETVFEMIISILAGDLNL